MLLVSLGASASFPSRQAIAAPRSRSTSFLPFVAIGGATLPAAPLEVHFLNVGQGNSILIKTPAGKTMLIDTGESTVAPQVATYLQTNLGTKSLDYVLITHYHADHLGAFIALLNNHGVTVTRATYDRGGPRSEYTSATYTNYYDLCMTINPSACKRTTLKEGDLIDLGAPVTVKALCVGDILTHQTCGQHINSENDYSILLLLSMGTFDIWLGGDTSGDTTLTTYADVEGAVVNQNKVNLALDGYGVDHHGSCTSSNQTLVAATRPTVSIFSLGANSYGHPCPATVARLSEVNSTLFYTADSSGHAVDGHVKIVYHGGSTYTVASLNGTRTFNTK